MTDNDVTYKTGDRVLSNGRHGRITRVLRPGLYLVNFGDAGNFRLRADETAPDDGVCPVCKTGIVEVEK